MKDMQERSDDEKRLLRETIRDLHLYIENLNCRYVPKPNDEIDEALATFIHHYPEKDKMKIMFLRESEGVYKFGQKRVFIKLDKGQALIRIGGGY